MAFYSLYLLLLVLCVESDAAGSKLLVGVFDMTHGEHCEVSRTFGQLFKSHFEEEISHLNRGAVSVISDVLDSCSSTVRGSQRIMNKLFNSNCSFSSYGFIGPGANSQMRSVLDMTSAYKIFQTSYGVMESDVVDEPDRYPYYRNIRTPAQILLELVCGIVEVLGWNYVSFSVTRHDKLNVNLCSNSTVDMSVSVLLKYNIDRGVTKLISPFKNMEDMEPPLVTMLQGDMSLDDIQLFSKALENPQNQEKPHIWLVPEQFLIAYVDLYNALPKFNKQQFVCYHSPAASALDLHPCAGCSLAQNVSRILGLKMFITLGIKTLLDTEHEEGMKGRSDRVQLFYLDPEAADLVKIANTSSGRNVTIDEVALERTGLKGLGKSICSLPCKTGEYSMTRAGEPASCFHCKNCISAREISNTTTCEECSNKTKPNEDNSACVAIEPDPHHHRTATGQAVIVLSVIGILSVGFTLCVFSRHRTTPIIRAANKELCYVIFAGLVISFSSVIVMMLPPGDMLCKLQITLLCFGASLTITTVLARAVRIIRIFTAKNVTMDTILISLKHQALFVGSLVALQTAIATSAAVSIKADVRVNPGTPQPVLHDICTAPNDILIGLFLGIFLGLCLVTSFISFKARKLPTNYNEVTYTYFTVFTMDVIITAFLGAHYSPAGDSDVTIVAMVTLLTGYLILVLLFGNKIYIIFFNPDQNKIHGIPESPTLRFRRHRRQSSRLVPALVAKATSVANTLPEQ